MLKWAQDKLSVFSRKKQSDDTQEINSLAQESAPDSDVNETGVTGDAPIRLPEDDEFGIAPFSRAIALAIRGSNARDGLVYAINGPWGSGKSSAINLVLHHLSEDESISITAFNPWWFSDAEALALSFFQEMQATVGKSLDEQARKAMANLGSRLSSAGPLLGGIAALAATPAAGAAVAGGAAFLERLTRIDTTVDQEYKKVSHALSSADKKFIIVIDDIDRLDTDNALQIFRLVKSVGRLPNVIYLMAFDRSLAEKMIAERFPSEGISYLDKVVQGGFDLPVPDPEDLRSLLLRQIDRIMGAPAQNEMPRFWNIFYDVVAPLLKTPRDIVRLGNAVSVSWPVVAEDVDRADFLAIETLRLLLPTVYEAIRARSDLLTGASEQDSQSRSLAGEYDGIFLFGLNPTEKEIAKRSLRRLFPRTEAVWSRISRSDDHRWQRDRLICSPVHFRTYFAFGVATDLITAAESKNLIASAGVPGATASTLLNLLAQNRRRGGTRAALALDELAGRSEDILETDVGQFLKDLFGVSDELDIMADESRGYGMASNQLRVHWLINNLFDRFELEKRNKLVLEAAPSSALGWLVSLSDRMHRKASKGEKEGLQEVENLVDDFTAGELYNLSTERIRRAATDGSLEKHPKMIELLFRWRDRTDDLEVRKWTDSKLENDAFIVKIAKESIRESWSHSMGGFGFLPDRVATRSEYVSINPLGKVMNVDAFRKRVEDLLAAEQLNEDFRIVLAKYKATPERDPTRDE